MGKLDGGCLCGSVRYTVDGEEPIMTAICHCTDCQKQTASAFSVIAGVAIEDLHVEGETKVFDTIGSDRGQPAHRHFCPQCGSPIMSILADADEVAWIKAGTLDDASWLTPELEAWTDSAQPWARTPERDDRGYFPRGLDTE
ncbi:GFA family protein [Patulibacter defluvii]|uniref:GFA family protein n=1 Tax=Patulibacter defluvii TaxID=3095358 RepID=UPI002A761300|nr:GFA family protein [Patulibacter sp. DM4]